MKIHLRLQRLIIYVLWLIILVVLFDYFRVWFLMMALIIALAGGALDVLLLYLMAGKTQVTVETEKASTEKNGDVPVFIHIVHDSMIPSSELRLTLFSENEFYGSSQEIEIAYPLYSAEDYHEKLPVTFTMLGTYRFRLQQASIRDFLGFVDLKIPLDSETELSVFPESEEVTEEKTGHLDDYMSEADESAQRGQKSDSQGLCDSLGSSNSDSPQQADDSGK